MLRAGLQGTCPGERRGDRALLLIAAWRGGSGGARPPRNHPPSSSTAAFPAGTGLVSSAPLPIAELGLYACNPNTQHLTQYLPP